MAYRDSTITTANALTLNATTPAAKAGDDMFTYFLTDGGLNSGITLTPPAGWTLITGSNQGANTGAPDGWTSWVYWKVASGNEPATYAWAIGAIPATDLTAIVVALSGRNNLNPTFITHGTVNTTGNATPVTVSDTGVTANTNDDILVFATGDITVGTDTWAFTPPANYTERQDSKFNFNVATLATIDGVLAGATGTLSLTLTRSAGTGTAGWGIFVIAVPAQVQVPIQKPVFIFPGKFSPIKPNLVHPTLQPIPGETITVDKWFEQYSNPITKPPLTALPPSSFFVPVVSQAEVITVDKWYQPIQQLLNKASYRQTGGEYRFEVPRTILVTDWFQPASLPVLRKPTQLLGGESRFEVPRTVLLSDWFAEIRQPYFSKFRLIPFGEYRFEVPRTILLSDWYREISQPYYSKLRQQPSGEYRTDVVAAAEVVTLDKWYQPAQQPYNSKQRNSNFGEYRFEVPRSVLLSDWFQAASEPVRNRLSQLLGGETRVEVVVSSEVVTLDKWYQPAQQPQRNIFIQVGEWQFSVEIVEEPIPPIPPIVIVSDPISRDKGWGKESGDEERRRINELLKDDEIIRMILLAWLNHYK